MAPGGAMTVASRGSRARHSGAAFPVSGESRPPDLTRGRALLFPSSPTPLTLLFRFRDTGGGSLNSLSPLASLFSLGKGRVTVGWVGGREGELCLARLRLYSLARDLTGREDEPRRRNEFSLWNFDPPTLQLPD
jgi:hypothetical protein